MQHSLRGLTDRRPSIVLTGRRLKSYRLAKGRLNGADLGGHGDPQSELLQLDTRLDIGRKFDKRRANNPSIRKA